MLLPVPVDGDDAADGDNPALDRALDLADRYDATLHALSVVDPTLVEPLATENAAVRESLEAEAEDAVEAVAERARDRGVDAETRVGHGTPADAIDDYAEDADVVVMATHGREGLGHALLGSVTEQVIRTSPAPVLAVPR